MERGRIHALSPDLCSNVHAKGRCNRRTHAPVACNQMRRSRDTVAKAQAGGMASVWQITAAGKKGKAARPVAKRGAESRRTAAINTTGKLRDIDSGHEFQHAQNGLLHRMGKIGIALRIRPHQAAKHQHACMFTTAIIMNPVRCCNRTHLFDHCRLVARPLRPAGQQVGRQAKPRQQTGGGSDMFCLTVMAGADQ